VNSSRSRSLVAGAALAVRCSAALLLLAACGRSSSNTLPSAPTPLLSKTAPDFGRVALDGARVDTASLRGRVVLIDFFAEHCVPCVKSLPALEALHRAEPNVAVVGVSEDDDADAARRMVARHGLSFPVVHDPEHALAGRYRVLELPATFVIDRRGVVRWRGAVEREDQIRAVVDRSR
jgi:peroxiredoxin